jgi:nucleoid-associated protein YgaU
MIGPTSRYANSSVVTLENNGQGVQVIVPSTPETYTFNYVYYITTAQDRVDTLAEAFYDDPTQWWRIGDANPEIMNWNEIPVGVQIRIPNA